MASFELYESREVKSVESEEHVHCFLFTLKAVSVVCSTLTICFSLLGRMCVAALIVSSLHRLFPLSVAEYAVSMATEMLTALRALDICLTPDTTERILHVRA